MKHLLKRFQLYLSIWLKLASYAVMEVFVNRGTSVLFFVGKALRFGISLIFILTIRQATATFGSYTTDQVVVFFLTYQFLDTITQILFRGVYFFSWQVKSGELDFYLAKPIHPLFRILTGKPDIIDAIFLVPTTLISLWLALPILQNVTAEQLMSYFLLLINGLLIAMSLHIVVICLGVLTTEVDNAIMLYRDINTMARFPVDVYREPLRGILFFLIPVGIMNTVPAQFLISQQPTVSLLTACGVGIASTIGSLCLWKWSVKRYTSAGG